ncbi:hypothetical protein K0M31_018481 [Melipona bicolor]|uniref:Uncharacterized protein n=1 Tax=Melipona bicolor TaxID=60889 RepID=A0AA40KRQ9_9HYME|nr:hypothetical protein K0M31_018481 [Melipona bicolor]
MAKGTAEGVGDWGWGRKEEKRERERLGVVAAVGVSGKGESHGATWRRHRGPVWWGRTGRGSTLAVGVVGG